mgnify:CR=1 FL=1
MNSSKEQIETRKSDLQKDFQTVKQQIEDSEVKIVGMKNNLNALAGAIQQCDMFLKTIEEKDAPMPAEKQQALDIATSQEKRLMDKLTQEELNGLSPRARKQYEDSNSVLSEITTENPNAEVVKEDKPKKKKEEQNEKL